ERRLPARRTPEHHLGPRARTKRDLGRRTRGRGEVDDVAADLLIEHDLRYVRPARIDVGGTQGRLDACLDGIAKLDSRLPAAQHLHLMGRGWIVEPDLEENLSCCASGSG